MTTGSTSNYFPRTTPAYYSNQAIFGDTLWHTYLSPTPGGLYDFSSWVGDDKSPIPPRPIGKTLVYTTLDRRGKVRTYRFRDRLPRRVVEKAPHSFTKTLTRIQNDENGLWTWIDPAWGYTEFLQVKFGSMFNTERHFPGPPTFTSNHQLALIGKLKEKVGGSDFDLGVFLAEGHEACHMIADAAIRVAEAYRLTRKGDIKTAIKILWNNPKRGKPRFKGGAPSNWLALQYGWLPLLGDIHDGAEALAHYVNVPFSKEYRVRQKTDPPCSQGPQRTTWPRGPDNVTVDWSNVQVTTRGQLIARMTESRLPPAFTGLLNPELIVWEKIPFSFVFDWLIPFGDYLDARGFASGLSGVFVETITSIYLEVPKNFGGNRTGDISYYRKEVSVTRTVSSSLQVPLPEVKPLGKVASWRHCANAIALLGQITKKL